MASEQGTPGGSDSCNSYTSSNRPPRGRTVQIELAYRQFREPNHHGDNRRAHYPVWEPIRPKRAARD